jgi:hypothetical protein
LNAKTRDWGYNTHIVRKEHNRMYDMLAKVKEWTNMKRKGKTITLYRHQSFSSPYEYLHVLTVCSPYKADEIISEIFICPNK